MVRILGLDYGDKTIGVAVSDEFGWTAQGLETIRRKQLEYDLDQLERIVKQYSCTEIVLGLPKNMNGTIGPRGEICKEFALLLEEKFDLTVHLWDERLTTVSAQRTLIEADVSRKKRKLVIDKMAAVLILQGFLDYKSKR